METLTREDIRTRLLAIRENSANRGAIAEWAKRISGHFSRNLFHFDDPIVWGAFGPLLCCSVAASSFDKNGPPFFIEESDIDYWIALTSGQDPQPNIHNAGIRREIHSLEMGDRHCQVVAYLSMAEFVNRTGLVPRRNIDGLDYCAHSAFQTSDNHKVVATWYPRAPGPESIEFVSDLGGPSLCAEWLSLHLSLEQSMMVICGPEDSEHGG